MNKLSLVVVTLFLSSCSMLIVRTAKYSDLALDEHCTRQKVVEVIGEPIVVTEGSHRSGNSTEIYRVKGRVFDSLDYWATRTGWLMTLGIHELFLFPMECWTVMSEAIYPTEKYLKVSYLNDHCGLFNVERKP